MKASRQARKFSRSGTKAPRRTSLSDRHRRRRNDDLPDEELMATIQSMSNEGRPSRMELKRGPVSAVVFIIVAVLLATAVLMGVFVNPLAGVVIAALSLVYMLANPAVWAAFFRARDRRKAEERIRARHQHDVQGGDARI
jgi:hypothetical protein